MLSGLGWCGGGLLSEGGSNETEGRERRSPARGSNIHAPMVSGSAGLLNGREDTLDILMDIEAGFGLGAGRAAQRGELLGRL